LKVFLDSVGCRLNQSEIENYARQFRAAGHFLVPNSVEADVMVLNTCAVTQSAVADSRKKVRQARRAGIEEILVTGCWSDIESEKALKMEGVRAVIPNHQKDELVAEFLNIPIENFDEEPIAREAIPGSRLKTRAFIKVQDGCDNHCTFCVTTIARGASRSRSIEQINHDIRSAILGGSKEIVLTGVHLGSWGYDFDKKQHLRNLVSELLQIPDLPRLRLSSLEPWDLDAEFFDLWSNPKLCRHLHLPLQSGSGATLRRMARNTTPEKYSKLVKQARSAIPDVAITSDVIVGFPGESEAEFSESLSFVQEMDFADGHIFTYSERPETAAAQMPQPVQNGLRKERNKIMRSAVVESGRKFREHFLGSAPTVLWESEEVLGPEQYLSVGLTDNYIRVEAESSRSLWNQMQNAELIALSPRGVRGRIEPQSENIWFQSNGSPYAG